MMDFELLLELQDMLDMQLFRGEVSWRHYEREWLSLLHAAGYTLKDYELGIDRRWDYLFDLRVPTQRRLVH